MPPKQTLWLFKKYIKWFQWLEPFFSFSFLSAVLPQNLFFVRFYQPFFSFELNPSDHNYISSIVINSSLLTYKLWFPGEPVRSNFHIPYLSTTSNGDNTRVQWQTFEMDKVNPPPTSNNSLLKLISSSTWFIHLSSVFYFFETEWNQVSLLCPLCYCKKHCWPFLIIVA